jgi:hypothetical protein
VKFITPEYEGHDTKKERKLVGLVRRDTAKDKERARNEAGNRYRLFNAALRFSFRRANRASDLKDSVRPLLPTIHALLNDKPPVVEELPQAEAAPTRRAARG